MENLNFIRTNYSLKRPGDHESFRREFEMRWNRNTPSPAHKADDYIQHGYLGAGQFGQVILMELKENGEKYAAKRLSLQKIAEMNNVEKVFNEKKILSSLDSPFWVRLIFSTKDEKYLYFFLPYCDGQDLFSYHRCVGKFTESTALFYAGQIVLALEYLHFHDVLYRDLKPEHIMLNSSGYIKITDMGLSKRVTGRAYTFCGTPEYIAPEMINMKPYSFSVDWWSFGVLLFELVNGSTPFSNANKDIMQMFNAICNGKYAYPIFFSKNLMDLINKFLTVDPSKRLGVVKSDIIIIKKHPWFKSINFLTLYNGTIAPPFTPVAQKPKHKKLREAAMADSAINLRQLFAAF